MTVNAMTETGIRELSFEEMASAAAGTFTPNTYRKNGYQEVGISTCYHFFDKDEFRFAGREITLDQANDIVCMAIRLNNMMNTGHRGNNRVGINEPAFIRAFNSQLYLKYGFTWDGKPGTDF